MTTFTETSFFNGTVSNGTDTLYTVPALTTAIIKNVHILNNTATAATITIWIDTDGTSATDAELFLDAYSVPAQDFISINTWQILAAAATIKATCGTTTAINVRLTGATIT